VNYDNSLVVTITVTSYVWAPSTSDHYLNVAPSPCRHSYLLSKCRLKGVHFLHWQWRF